MARGNEPILCFDVGNTRVKVGMFQDGRLTRSASIDQQPRFEPELQLEDWLQKEPIRQAALATVHPEVSNRIITFLARRSIAVEPILKSAGTIFDTGFLDHDLETPHTTGVDRLLSSIAARQRSPGQAVIVIDCGSAITVNLTTAQGVFLGGAIMPGLRLMRASLHEQTAQLPKTPLSSTQTPIGKSTASAISAGAYYAATAGIDRLANEFRKETKIHEDVSVYLTGGDAEPIATGLTTIHQLCPHLVLEGLCYVADHWREQRGERS